MIVLIFFCITHTKTWLTPARIFLMMTRFDCTARASAWWRTKRVSKSRMTRRRPTSQRDCTRKSRNGNFITISSSLMSNFYCTLKKEEECFPHSCAANFRVKLTMQMTLLTGTTSKACSSRAIPHVQRRWPSWRSSFSGEIERSLRRSLMLYWYEKKQYIVVWRNLWSSTLHRNIFSIVAIHSSTSHRCREKYRQRSSCRTLMTSQNFAHKQNILMLKIHLLLIRPPMTVTRCLSTPLTHISKTAITFHRCPIPSCRGPATKRLLFMCSRLYYAVSCCHGSSKISRWPTHFVDRYLKCSSCLK